MSAPTTALYTDTTTEYLLTVRQFLTLLARSPEATRESRTQAREIRDAMGLIIDRTGNLRTAKMKIQATLNDVANLRLDMEDGADGASAVALIQTIQRLLEDAKGILSLGI